jgi:hypothetical protein
MPANREETGVIQGKVRFLEPEFMKTGSVLGVGKEATSSRAGIIVEVKVVSQGDLLAAGAALDSQEFVPFKPPLLLGAGGRKKAGGKGTENQPLQSRLAFNQGHGVTALGHGTLSQDFASDNKGSPAFSQHFSGAAKAKDAAV